MSASSTAVVRGFARVMRLPSAAITPDMPLTDAIASGRPNSMARAREISNCCSIWAVWMNIALLVCTTAISAPWVTCS